MLDMARTGKYNGCVNSVSISKNNNNNNLTRRCVMSKITKIVTAAAVLGVLGVTALPVASFAETASDAVTVSVQVADGMSLDCDKNYTKNFGAASNATDNSGDTGSASETSAGVCTVHSNDGQGYTLGVRAAVPALTGATNTSVTIPANASHSAGVPGYSIKWGTGTTYSDLSSSRTALTTSDQQIASTTGVSATTTGDKYVYGFASSIATTTIAETYSTTVTFTATGK
jgi:hypothetical protein